MAGIRSVGILSLVICSIITLLNISIVSFHPSDNVFISRAAIEFFLLIVLTVVVPMLQSFLFVCCIRYNLFVDGTAAYQAGVFGQLSKELHLFYITDALYMLLFLAYEIPHIVSPSSLTSYYMQFNVRF